MSGPVGARSAVDTAEIPTYECAICDERTPRQDLAMSVCDHVYCTFCFIEWFESALADDTLFPPRCCQQPVPLPRINKDILGSRLVQRISQKQAELADRNRIYCSNPACSAYIATDGHNGKDAACPACTHATCISCRQPAHPGDCQLDRDGQAVMTLAREQGWHACLSCGRLIELRDGCNHVECPCGASFCYLCGAAPWRSCACPRYNRAADRDYRRPYELNRLGRRTEELSRRCFAAPETLRPAVRGEAVTADVDTDTVGEFAVVLERAFVLNWSEARTFVSYDALDSLSDPLRRVLRARRHVQHGLGGTDDVHVDMVVTVTPRRQSTPQAADTQGPVKAQGLVQAIATFAFSVHQFLQAVHRRVRQRGLANTATDIAAAAGVALFHVGKWTCLAILSLCLGTLTTLFALLAYAALWKAQDVEDVLVPLISVHGFAASMAWFGAFYMVA